MIKSIKFIFALLACTGFAQEKKLIIAISKTAPESHYVKFLRRANPDVQYVNMYTVPFDSIDIILNKCSGILLTGGNDIVPSIYGKAKEKNKCEDFDVNRDSLELKLIRAAVKRKMPVLGICRGEQILNVGNGGSLFTDIPTDIGKKVSHRNDTMAYHHVVIKEGTLLYKICGVNEGTVNSAHHQCVDKIAGNLVVSAKADDGVVEAYELKDQSSEPFMLGVQWHPEKLDNSNPLSTPLAIYFIQKATEYKPVK